MKKLRRYWKSVPKPYRLTLNILIIGVLVFLLYTFISAPPFTTEIKFRRIEKANMLGPSQIMGQYERNFSIYNRFLLADDGDGIIIYAESTWDDTDPDLICRPKTGNLTVLGAPDPSPFDAEDTDRSMTVFAFDSHPEAVRAEMDLTLNAVYRGETFTRTYTMETQREIDGVFIFTQHVHSHRGLFAEGYAMQVFTLISGYGGKNFSDSLFPATVRFYDAQGRLIAEESTTVQSAAKTNS